jgi:hypothetical protein
LFIHTFIIVTGSREDVDEDDSSDDGSDCVSSDAHNDDDDDGGSSDGENVAPVGQAFITLHGESADRPSVLKDQTFGDFEELKKYVESITLVTMSNNKRTTRVQKAPAWFKVAFPDAQICWLNGTLYCHQPLKASHDHYAKWAKTTCSCKVRYALCSKTKRWRISEFDECHNHVVESHVETSATGIIHIRNAARLNQDMIVTINNWLDAHQSEYSQLCHLRTY